MSAIPSSWRLLLVREHAGEVQRHRVSRRDVEHRAKQTLGVLRLLVPQEQDGHRDGLVEAHLAGHRPAGRLAAGARLGFLPGLVTVCHVSPRLPNVAVARGFSPAIVRVYSKW